MTQPEVAGGWSIKDIVAHITGWRRRTVNRFRAALNPSTDMIALYLRPSTITCCLPPLPAAFHHYLLPPTTTCCSPPTTTYCLPPLPTASHHYLLPPTTTCCLSRLLIPPTDCLIAD